MKPTCQHSRTALHWALGVLLMLSADTSAVKAEALWELFGLGERPSSIVKEFGVPESNEEPEPKTKVLAEMEGRFSVPCGKGPGPVTRDPDDAADGDTGDVDEASAVTEVLNAVCPNVSFFLGAASWHQPDATGAADERALREQNPGAAVGSSVDGTTLHGGLFLGVYLQRLELELTLFALQQWILMPEVFASLQHTADFTTTTTVSEGGRSVENKSRFESDPAWGGGVGVALSNGSWLINPYFRLVVHRVSAEITRRFIANGQTVREERSESSIDDTSACGGVGIERSVGAGNATLGARLEQCDVDDETWRAIGAFARFGF